MAKQKMYNVPAAQSSKPRAKDSAPRRELIANNKKARHDYLIEDVYEAGLVLSGTEVKALRAGRASLIDGWVSIDHNQEAWLEVLTFLSTHMARGQTTPHAGNVSCCSTGKS